MLGRLADEGVLTFGTHFPSAPVGHVIPQAGGGTWRFDPA